MKFGDLLRYPDDQGVGDDILFMYLGKHLRWSAGHSRPETYLNVMVVRTTEDDDQWEPGTVVAAGVEELIPYVEPKPKGLHILVDGEDMTDKLDVKELSPGIFDIGGSFEGDITIEMNDV